MEEKYETGKRKKEKRSNKNCKEIIQSKNNKFS